MQKLAHSIFDVCLLDALRIMQIACSIDFEPIYPQEMPLVETNNGSGTIFNAAQGQFIFDGN